MERFNKWIRVNHDHPCPVCGRRDWCTRSPDGRAVMCQRVKSDRPAKSGGGFIHIVDGSPIALPQQITPPRKSQPTMDWKALNTAFGKAMSSERFKELSDLLGISTETLRLMQWGWSERLQRWTVPMRDEIGTIIGIKTRLRDNSKRSISGSQEGLFFVPSDLQAGCLIIPEGASDTAALIDAGFNWVVGRPSCCGGTNQIVQLIRRLFPIAVLLVPDRDSPGLDGAKRLANVIIMKTAVPVHGLDAVIPPVDVKDVRAWYKKNPDDLAGQIGASVAKLTQRMEGTTHE